MKSQEYVEVYGPSTGDRIRLGDTGLTVEVTADDSRIGDEFVIGFGKTARDGIHMVARATKETCDLVISNVVVMDPIAGIRKTSIGIRNGRIHAIGRAGNPDTLDGVDVVVGTGTSVFNAEGLIATPGGVDTHVHLLTPRVIESALSSGITTIVAQNTGPNWGVGVGDSYAVRSAIRALDAWPINIGWLGRGSASRPDSLEEILVEGGVVGFKVHEDLGANARALDTALTVADEFDVQVAIHTDGINESLSVTDTVTVIGGRTVHAFHVEGCGGGHVPDVLTLAGISNVIGSSTNPTLPYGRDAVAEHHAMIMDAHGLKANLPSDLAMVHDRIRAGTMAAEGVLHDLGIIPITSSDAQGMGRAGETFARTFALAGAMKAQRGPMEGDDDRADNERALRYLAKLTINPAIAHGMSDEIGALTPGRLADVVLWHPAYFGVKPYLIYKAGIPAWGLAGDPNASVYNTEPLIYRPQFGGYGAAPADISLLFVNGACAAAGEDILPTTRHRVAVHNCRTIGLTDMVRHGRLGTVAVEPHEARVTLDGEHIGSEPVERAALARLYLL